MPLAAAVSAAVRGAPAATVTRVVAAAAAIVTVVMAYSWAQVRAGRWAHVDASDRAERRSLNLVLAGILLVAGASGVLVGDHRSTGIALLVSGALVLLAMALSRHAKVSLHVTFACFGAVLCWPHVPATIAGLLLAAAIGWSRLALRRHVPLEVALGAVSGVAGGLVFQLAG